MGRERPERLDRHVYERELERLQDELVVMEQWVDHTGAKVVVLFEGRDAAGKGGTIKRIVEPLNPRGFRLVSLPVPTERERSQWYFQRFVQHLPAAGELVFFDRSWYSRALVEHVMGFCTAEQVDRFLDQAPAFERMLRDDGIIVVKYWLSVSAAEQRTRLVERAEDPAKRWKLSPMDAESVRRYPQYTAARDRMVQATDTPWAPWYLVDANDKRRARLTVIQHLLSVVPYTPVRGLPVPKVPKPSGDHEDLAVLPSLAGRRVPSWGSAVAEAS